MGLEEASSHVLVIDWRRFSGTFETPRLKNPRENLFTFALIVTTTYILNCSKNKSIVKWQNYVSYFILVLIFPFGIERWVHVLKVGKFPMLVQRKKEILFPEYSIDRLF